MKNSTLKLLNTKSLQLAATGSTMALATFAYGSLYERNAFTVRKVTVDILPPGTSPLKILHISDIHMMPQQKLKKSFIHSLSRLNPDLVINTGDNLSHPNSVKHLVQALDPLLHKPGIFIFGSNDYYAPKPKNPLTYLFGKKHAPSTQQLPWKDMRAAFTEWGWLDATHARHSLIVAGLNVYVAGVDDPHIERDNYDLISGIASVDADIRIGLTHSPEPRVLDRFHKDGYDLVLAGHTHGGQVCLPGYGAIITNSGIDRERVKGTSTWGDRGMILHVSAGIGTSPYAPFRTFCKPEASLITLTPAKNKDGQYAPSNTQPQFEEELI